MGYWKSWLVQLNASSQYGPWPGLEAGAVDVSYVYVLPCLVGVEDVRAHSVQGVRQQS